MISEKKKCAGQIQSFDITPSRLMRGAGANGGGGHSQSSVGNLLVQAQSICLRGAFEVR